MISKELAGEILEPIIMHREREGLNESDFHHLVRSVMQVCDPNDQHRLIGVAMEMIHLDLTIPPEQRSPGAPGSKPNVPNS